MVSGFLISPKDQLRMRSGDAIPIWIWSNVSGLAIWLVNLVSSCMLSHPVGVKSWCGRAGGRYAARSRLFRRLRPRVLVLVALVERREFDVETQRTHFLHEHVEALRDAGLEGVVALDDRLVDLGPADHVVGLHGEHFLQRVGGAVGLQRPDLHLAEALAAELRLAAERLLGDQ